MNFLGIELRLRGERPASNRLGLGATLRTKINLLYICKESAYTAQRTVSCSCFILPPPVLKLKYTGVSFLGNYKTEFSVHV